MDKPYINFEEFYTDCLIYCVNNFIGPDDYVWNLSKCDEWRKLYEARISVEDAVGFVFGFN